MKLRYWIIPAVLVAIFVGTTTPKVRAGSSFSETFDPTDVRTLLTVVQRYLSPSDQTIAVTFMPADKMPAYDPDTHYAGLDPRNPHTADVWVWENLQKHFDPSILVGAFALAAMDTGDAGPNWKQIYDTAAQADAQLPANAPDPYLNRHKLEVSVSTFLK